MFFFSKVILILPPIISSVIPIEKRVERLNYRIFEWINQMALKNRLLDNLMIFSSKVLPYLMALLICAVFLYGVLRRDAASRKSAVMTALLLAVNLAVNFLIGCLVYVPRPFVSHKVNLLFPHVRDSSFPSDHATVTMSTAAGLMRAGRILGWICVFLSLLVGFSRIYVGHHYPLDVLGSYLIVIATNSLFHRFFEGKAASLYFRADEMIFRRRSKTAPLS